MSACRRSACGPALLLGSDWVAGGVYPGMYGYWVLGMGTQYPYLASGSVQYKMYTASPPARPQYILY